MILSVIAGLLLLYYLLRMSWSHPMQIIIVNIQPQNPDILDSPKSLYRYYFKYTYKRAPRPSYITDVKDKYKINDKLWIMRNNLSSTISYESWVIWYIQSFLFVIASFLYTIHLRWYNAIFACLIMLSIKIAVSIYEYSKDV